MINEYNLQKFLKVIAEGYYNINHDIDSTEPSVAAYISFLYSLAMKYNLPIEKEYIKIEKTYKEIEEELSTSIINIMEV